MLAMRMHNNKTQWSDKVVQHQNEGDQLWILPSWHFAQTSLLKQEIPTDTCTHFTIIMDRQILNSVGQIVICASHGHLNEKWGSQNGRKKFLAIKLAHPIWLIVKSKTMFIKLLGTLKPSPSLGMFILSRCWTKHIFFNHSPPAQRTTATGQPVPEHSTFIQLKKLEKLLMA